MKQFIFGNYDKDHKFFDGVHLVKESKENYIVGVIRSVKLCKDVNILHNIAGKQLFCLGFIDDESGIITSSIDLCIDYDEIVSKMELEVKSDDSSKD